MTETRTAEHTHGTHHDPQFGKSREGFEWACSCGVRSTGRFVKRYDGLYRTPTGAQLSYGRHLLDSRAD